MAATFVFASPVAHCAASRLEPIHDTRLVGQLRFKQVPLTGVIVASWVIAFVEYCMVVPANRWDVTPDLRLYLARYWGQRFESTSSKSAERSHDAAVPAARIN